MTAMNNNKMNTFVNNNNFMSYDELDNWLSSEEWQKMIGNNFEIVMYMSDVRITEEFYRYIKGIYENIQEENIVKSIGRELYNEGIKLKSEGNEIYENPMKRMQDGFYVMIYIVKILLDRKEEISVNEKYRIWCCFRERINKGFEGIGGWRN